MKYSYHIQVPPGNHSRNLILVLTRPTYARRLAPFRATEAKSILNLMVGAGLSLYLHIKLPIVL